MKYKKIDICTVLINNKRVVVTNYYYKRNNLLKSRYCWSSHKDTYVKQITYNYKIQ